MTDDASTDEPDGPSSDPPPSVTSSTVTAVPSATATTAPSWRVSLAEIDTRLFGMITAVIVIWIAFNVLSGGAFLTSRNLWNLSVQSTSIAIMATGMVLIIVSRNIDLSVGSLLGFLGYSMALVQTDGVIAFFNVKIDLGGIGDSSWIWLIALAFGISLGALVGAIQGFIIAYGGVPAFIVTLGGFLVWRGMIFRTGEKQGQTLAPLDKTFRLFGGGPDGSLGEWKSWVFAALGCGLIVVALWLARRRRQRYDLRVRPLWMDVTFGVIGCAVVVAGVGRVANNYISPITGNPTGIAYPVVILIVATLAMTYLSRQRRFGRYVYAYGGNPEAAELGGINTRRTVMLTFVLMGVLVGISAAIQTARLNAAVTNLGVQNELDVIAAAVIGGTSFAGGIGTIAGAVLGAVIMQSLRSGMVLLNIDSPSQDIVVGVVLVTAVAIDSTLRLGRKRVALAALAIGLIIAATVIQTGRA
jgi:D-xylose transport system permease protein